MVTICCATYSSAKIVAIFASHLGNGKNRPLITIHAFSPTAATENNNSGIDSAAIENPISPSSTRV